MFTKNINTKYLSIAKIVYGGDLYFNLQDYKLCDVELSDTSICKVVDTLLKKRNIENFYCYKNLDTGFSANLFKSIKSNELVIAYRGTERPGLGENENDIISLMKDITTDVNLLTGAYDEQFSDAWKFYKTVKEQNPKRKIILVGQSLGGALAQVVAAKEYTINRKKLETYTYNAPGCRHLLDVYDCNTCINYSFITNYIVMNDWCGCYGEHIGVEYLIPPINILPPESDSFSAVLNNLLLNTHEGIFEYSKESYGKIFKRPKDFSQSEGLSFWYFDNNNPLRNYKSLNDFIDINFPQLKILQAEIPIEFAGNKIKAKTEQFFKENIPQEVQNSNVALAIKNAADNFIQNQKEQTEKILSGINNTSFSVAIKTLNEILSELSLESYEKALKIYKRELK